MLSLHHHPERLAAADNLIPTLNGTMATRDGAIQITEGDIQHVVPWGPHLLLEKQGRIALRHGDTETDLAPAGLNLSAAPMQVPVSGVYENRLYVADGVSPLWYVLDTGTAYELRTFVNTITDPGGEPYAIPIPRVVASWRDRIWIGDGSNRVYHSQAKIPEEWDPLWDVTCQGKHPDLIVTLIPNGEEMAVGLREGFFSITGTSQLNWQRSETYDKGVAGLRAATTDNNTLYWVSPTGIHSPSQDYHDDLMELFHSEAYPAEIVVDKKRKLLLVLIRSRIFVMHLGRPGAWGEITGVSARGLFASDDQTGWYGEDGIWALYGKDMADQLVDGSTRAVTSVYKTFAVQPNRKGRAKLPRTRMLVNGSARGQASYTVETNEDTSFGTTISLSDNTPSPWDDKLSVLSAADVPVNPVLREVSPQLAGSTFQHTLSADCFMEIRQFDPDYKFKER